MTWANVKIVICLLKRVWAIYILQSSLFEGVTTDVFFWVGGGGPLDAL